MAKYKISKSPTSNSKITLNYPEQDHQFMGNNPLKFKEQSKLEDTTIGKSYPIEKEGIGNAEAENGEIIVKKDLKLFKIGGKSHAQGGTDILMEPSDFIFSNSLKLKGDILKSEFGLSDKKEYSFSDVAKKYLDMNNFHKLAESTDPLERVTGEKMIKNYHDKLAKLAFIQEAQKGMPNGIPAIAAPLMEKVANIPQNPTETPAMKDGGEHWIQGAIKHPGRCTPGSPNYDCPKGSPQYNLMITLKKHHGFHEDGGECEDCDKQEMLMKKGGQLPKYDNAGEYKITTYPGDKTNKKNAGNVKSEDWTALAKQLKFKPTATNQQDINKEFQQYLYKYNNGEYADIIDKEHSKEGKGPTKSGQVFEGNLGYRWDDIYNNISKSVPKSTPSAETPTVTPETQNGFTEGSSPDFSAKTIDSQYKDLGYSSPEKLGMLLAAAPIPSYAPTRYQNYGLQSALGALSNVMPYNYQSVINEANRSGYNASQANNAFGRTPQAMANNSLIAGQIAEATSKIKGDEYNQNANLYNTNQSALANLMSQIGQDKEQQGQLYGDRIVQGKENLWANRRMRDKEFLAQYANATNNRSLRNTYAFLGQSVNPNYPILSADMATQFMAPNNPFVVGNNYGNNKAVDMGTDFNNFKKQFKNTNLQDKDLLDAYFKYKTKNPN